MLITGQGTGAEEPSTNQEADGERHPVLLCVHPVGQCPCVRVGDGEYRALNHRNATVGGIICDGGASDDDGDRLAAGRHVPEKIAVAIDAAGRARTVGPASALPARAQWVPAPPQRAPGLHTGPFVCVCVVPCVVCSSR